MGKLHAAQRGRLAGGVGVEAEVDDPRQPAELTDVMLGERRAHRRDHRLDAGLAQREHVGVALDHDRAALLRDRVARGVSP